jgi:hypothetical protein
MCEPFASTSNENCAKLLYDFGNVSGLLSTAHECLMVCQESRSAEESRLSEERKKQAESVLSSQDRYSDLEKRELLHFQCALAASKCRIELDDAFVNNGADEPSVDALTAAARGATMAAATTTKSDPKVNAKYGTPYLQFLSAWSGMYHSPWPFCTLGQARMILRNARDAVAVAQKVWGRQDAVSSVLEQIMLDIGEADLEGSLMGGLTTVADGLYRKAMGVLEEKEGQKVLGMNEHVKGMMKVHCLLGLAKLSLSSDLSDAIVAAEELARNALDILSFLDPNSNYESEGPVLLCIYAWSVPFLNRLSHSYHICASRQLVAEACIRSSRPEDARNFLTEAVKGKLFCYAAYEVSLFIISNISTPFVDSDMGSV